MTTIQDKAPMPLPPAWTVQEPESVYHACSKSGEFMSSGMLRTFRDCPYAYHLAVSGQTKGRDSTAYRFGRAVHAIVLEGHKAFNKRYAVGGPINDKTGKCYGVGTQKFNEWLAENGLSMDRVISEEECTTLVRMANMVEKHAEAAAFFDFGWPELVMRADLHGVPCKIRMDWLTRNAAGDYVIVDLKTADDITWFEKDAIRYRYPHQFAFYRDVFQAVAGVAAHVSAVVVEKKEPFRVGIWHLPPEVLDYYSSENLQALELFKQCQVADRWPTGYEAPRDFSLPRDKIGA